MLAQLPKFAEVGLEVSANFWQHYSHLNLNRCMVRSGYIWNHRIESTMSDCTATAIANTTV